MFRRYYVGSDAIHTLKYSMTPRCVTRYEMVKQFHYACSTEEAFLQDILIIFNRTFHFFEPWRYVSSLLLTICIHLRSQKNQCCYKHYASRQVCTFTQVSMNRVNTFIYTFRLIGSNLIPVKVYKHKSLYFVNECIRTISTHA